jgi:hypothetical protein
VHDLRILIVSFYFRPDLCAGSFRATALVDSLLLLMSPDSQIDVITTLPNRYNTFSTDAQELEHQHNCSIYRIAIPEHRSGMLDQSKTYFTFARAAIKQAADKDYDLVFATSSRLMTAVLGALIARRNGSKLYLDIRDIFVDTIKDVLPRKVAWMIVPIFSLIEKWAIKKADKVNLVSAGFSDYFSTRYPQQRFSYFTNGIDDEFLAAAPDMALVAKGKNNNKTITVLYAGNLGEGQGLHKIIPELAKRLESCARFIIIGDGGRKHELEISLLENSVTNVEMLPPIKRNELIEAYLAADILFLHLNDYDAFKKVLPSKIFEYAALGKPIWAGVSGYAAEFIRSEIENAAVFQPCDVDGAVLAYKKLSLHVAPRSSFLAKYARSSICHNMAEDILAIANGKF